MDYLEEFKEMPFEDSHEDNEILEEDETTTHEVLEERSKQISSLLFRRLGYIVLFLGIGIIPLIILTFFFNTGQPDDTSLLVEQIVGFILVGLAVIIGNSLLFTAKKIEKSEDLVHEPISKPDTE